MEYIPHIVCLLLGIVIGIAVALPAIELVEGIEEQHGHPTGEDFV